MDWGVVRGMSVCVAVLAVLAVLASVPAREGLSGDMGG